MAARSSATLNSAANNCSRAQQAAMNQWIQFKSANIFHWDMFHPYTLFSFYIRLVCHYVWWKTHWQHKCGYRTLWNIPNRNFTLVQNETPWNNGAGRWCSGVPHLDLVLMCSSATKFAARSHLVTTKTVPIQYTNTPAARRPSVIATSLWMKTLYHGTNTHDICLLQAPEARYVFQTQRRVIDVCRELSSNGHGKNEMQLPLAYVVVFGKFASITSLCSGKCSMEWIPRTFVKQYSVFRGSTVPLILSRITCPRWYETSELVCGWPFSSWTESPMTWL